MRIGEQHTADDPSPYVFRFEGTWDFPVDGDDVWAALRRTDDYPLWWSWLRRIDVVELRPGTHCDFVIAAPLPYRLRLRASVRAVVPGRLVEVDVGGDLAGPAHLRLTPGAGSCRASLSWELTARRRFLRLASITARPILEWGHRRVVGVGVEQFVGRALGRDAQQARPRPTAARSGVDVLMAAGAAAVLSGVPSTAAALVRRTSVLHTTRAAGTLLGRSTLPRGLAAHSILSIGWTVALAHVLPRRHTAAWGAAAGLGIAALDLGVVSRRFPAIRRLAMRPQVADHLAFGLVVGAVLAQREASGERSPG